MTRHGKAVTMLVGTVLRVKSLLALSTYAVSLSKLFAADSCPKRRRNWWRYHPSASNDGGFITDQWLPRAVRKAKSS